MIPLSFGELLDFRSMPYRRRSPWGDMLFDNANDLDLLIASLPHPPDDKDRPQRAGGSTQE
jgi:hypothetical protein